MNLLLIFLGGGLGSLLRFSLSWLFRSMEITRFPWATLAANFLSCILLGWLVYKLDATKSPLLFAFAVVGVCGGFSTFSTFSLETLELVKNGQMMWAILNVALSLVTCLFILFVWSKSLET